MRPPSATPPARFHAARRIAISQPSLQGTQRAISCSTRVIKCLQGVRFACHAGNRRRRATTAGAVWTVRSASGRSWRAAELKGRQGEAQADQPAAQKGEKAVRASRRQSLLRRRILRVETSGTAFCPPSSLTERRLVGHLHLHGVAVLGRLLPSACVAPTNAGKC